MQHIDVLTELYMLEGQYEEAHELIAKTSASLAASVRERAIACVCAIVCVCVGLCVCGCDRVCVGLCVCGCVCVCVGDGVFGCVCMHACLPARAHHSLRPWLHVYL
jgi:hypothetical protein